MHTQRCVRGRTGKFGRLATAQAFFTVGFKDEAAVPSSVYATYNAYAVEKQMFPYLDCGHSGSVF